ncbi:MAG TPA: hypothetical protein VKY85_13695 [Candidatus Angelobacter sp.]|nr:hypothetical protein [Candidatus Angelobacter sp.]
MKTTKRSAKPSTRGRFDLTERKRPWRRLISFPGVKGKVAKAAWLFTTGGCHSITLEFQDKTALHFDIEPGLTFYADYYNCEDRQRSCTQALASHPQPGTQNAIDCKPRGRRVPVPACRGSASRGPPWRAPGL